MLFVMMRHQLSPAVQGPFRSDQIHPGDRYELSAGHPVWCSPTGGRGAKAMPIGSAVLGSDPAVDEVGIDAGFTPDSRTVRAPDVAIGNVPDAPGWIAGCPALAVEYADTGQDEADLAIKIRELLAAGTKWVWVVRLVGPRRVEIHSPGQPVRVASPGEQLEAPGVLRNPVPVEALYDPEVGREATLRNLLQRHGYDSLEAVRAEGVAAGRSEGVVAGEIQTLRESILEALAVRGLALSEAEAAVIAYCDDRETLRRWRRSSLTAGSVAAVFVASA
jgi:Uma2 family endonuclease